MFNFIRKSEIWDACDRGFLDELKSKTISYQLKIAQDLAIYRNIRSLQRLDIAEIGGGNSRILERLAQHNRCVNIEKFEGLALGPTAEVRLDKVNNINCYVGDFDPELRDNQFDLIFSISVVEHIETERLDDFFSDSLRILKPGGVFYHAIDMYIQDNPSSYNLERYNIYKKWVAGYNTVEPIGKVYGGGLEFCTDMVSNPDNILYGWNKLVPSLSRLRADAQNVSLVIGARKVSANVQKNVG